MELNGSQFLMTAEAKHFSLRTPQKKCLFPVREDIAAVNGVAGYARHSSLQVKRHISRNRHRRNSFDRVGMNIALMTFIAYIGNSFIKYVGQALITRKPRMTIEALHPRGIMALSKGKCRGKGRGRG